jgi:outer membrane scaffolding protein for murein synthesis (MipA/OmpV family)
MNLKNILLLALLALVPAKGQASFFDKNELSGALGGQYMSLIERRGIIVYDGYQAFPIYSVNLWNPNLQLVGSTLNYRWSLLEDTLVLRARANFDATNDEPLYETDEKEEDRIRRKTTNEVEGFVEWRAAKLLELNANISQDVGAHGGTHAEIGTRIILGEYIKKNKSYMIQPALFASIGAASKDYNEYLYGSGAVSGVSHYSAGFSISTPAVIDYFYPVFKATWFGLIDSENRNASYVRKNEKDSFQILALFAFKVF